MLEYQLKLYTTFVFCLLMLDYPNRAVSPPTHKHHRFRVEASTFSTSPHSKEMAVDTPQFTHFFSFIPGNRLAHTPLQYHQMSNKLRYITTPTEFCNCLGICTPHSSITTPSKFTDEPTLYSQANGQSSLGLFCSTALYFMQGFPPNHL